MIGQLLEAAHRLDAWMRQHLGRPYTALLGWGLVASIAAAISNLGETVKSGASVLKITALIVLQLALLVNQLAQLYEHRQARRAAKSVP